MLPKHCAGCNKIGKAYCDNCASKKKVNPAYHDPIYRRNRKIMIEAVWAQRGACWKCLEPFAQKKDITADHAVMLRDGGDHSLGNLRPAHEKCNKGYARRKAEKPAPSVTLDTFKQNNDYLEWLRGRNTIGTLLGCLGSIVLLHDLSRDATAIRKLSEAVLARPHANLSGILARRVALPVLADNGAAHRLQGRKLSIDLLAVAGAKVKLKALGSNAELDSLNFVGLSANLRGCTLLGLEVTVHGNAGGS